MCVAHYINWNCKQRPSKDHRQVTLLVSIHIYDSFGDDVYYNK